MYLWNSYHSQYCTYEKFFMWIGKNEPLKFFLFALYALQQRMARKNKIYAIQLLRYDQQEVSIIQRQYTVLLKIRPF